MKQLQIFVDRLKNDQTLKIDETLPPDFLGIDESELSFKEPVHTQGEVYLADDHLVIHLAIDTVATLPCSICNETVTVPIQIKNLYLTQPLAEISGSIFDLGEEVRETVILQTPLFVECSGGKCPEREQIKKFFKKELPPEKDEVTINFPFADLK